KIKKMRRIIFVITLINLVVLPFVKAQDVITDEINYNVMEKLIQMAKEHYPQRKISEENTKIAKNNVTVANLSYLEPFNVNYYYRPDEKQTLNPENPYITNGIQFGININPSSLFAKPFQAKTAKSNYKISQLQKEAFDAELEKQVKTRYYNYILKLRDFKQNVALAQTAKGAFLDLSNSFQRGEITMEEYNDARTLLAESDYSK